MNHRIKVYPAVYPFVLMVLCILNIEAVINGIRKALSLCALSIVPSLFLFMVLSNIVVTLLLEEDSLFISPKLLAFVLGALCGFPIGAVICEKLCQSHTLSKDDASKILPFCNGASPAFVIGAIGVSMIGDRLVGVLLYFSLIIASIIPLCIIKTTAKANTCIVKKQQISEIFFSSIEKSVQSILKICALICFFSAVIALLEDAGLSFISIFLEIGSGSSWCASIYNENPLLAVALCGFCCGFSGICVHLQILSSLKSVKVKYSVLCFCKLLQGILCSLFSFTGYYLCFYT